ncbi:MAG: response regulator transcription factor [Sphaerobacter sp.]|nr:response regulator transcription factor [Sphaerobacter sp.]
MAEQATIRILIVDEHDAVRRGLVTALAVVDDLRVVGEATSGAEALRLCGELQPDVVLMEIRLPDQDGVCTIRRIRRQFPLTQVVVLTTVPAADLRQHAAAAGARGYLPKFVALDELTAVIRAAHAASCAEAGPHPPGDHQRGSEPGAPTTEPSQE